MEFGVIIETKEPEKAWNAFRFAVASLGEGHEVKVFLMGEAVECQGLTHNKFDVDAKCERLQPREEYFLACGTCLKLRQMDGTELCPISTMADYIQMVEGSIGLSRFSQFI